MTKQDSRRQRIREAYETAIGPWQDIYTPVLEADPAIVEAFVAFRRVPYAAGNLTRKYQELILLAVNASATHLYVPAISAHMKNALHEGASSDEILEVLEMVSVIGMHTCSTGVPILLEELAAAGMAPPKQLAPRQQEVKDRFLKERGWWSDFLEAMVILQPDLLEAYVGYSTVPWKRGAIPPKMKELVYIAIDAQTTHLYVDGLRSHIRNALKLGATAEEITEVFALISGMGFHTLTVAVPELQRLKKD
jgi:alkylhydroperoxidase/carboxymuconolactone decarboxylase family protein YurZ